MKTCAAVQSALIGVLLLAIGASQGRASDHPSPIFSAHHELRVELETERSRLHGRDRIRIHGVEGQIIHLRLAASATP